MSLDKLKSRFWASGNRTESGCLEWGAYRDKDGYGRLGSSYGLVKVYGERKVSRIAWVLTSGSIPYGKLVLHSCDNTACFEPSHLRLGTELENMQEKIAKGRQGDCRHLRFRRADVLPQPPQPLPRR